MAQRRRKDCRGSRSTGLAEDPLDGCSGCFKFSAVSMFAWTDSLLDGRLLGKRNMTRILGEDGKVGSREKVHAREKGCIGCGLTVPKARRKLPCTIPLKSCPKTPREARGKFMFLVSTLPACRLYIAAALLSPALSRKGESIAPFDCRPIEPSRNLP